MMLKRFYSSGLILLLVFLASSLSVPARASFPEFTELVEKVQPSVVSIQVDVVRWGRTAGRSGGSGFIVDDEGYILTNHHVIDNGSKVTVKLFNGREFEAEVVGSDANTDVALLKIEPGKQKLNPLKLGTSEVLKVGEWVLAFGAPFNLEQTVTAGIVSAKGRGEVGSQYVPFIQTDVAINRGNSGGPLINLEGEVVGINSMIFNPMVSSGLSFSIPIDLVNNVRQQLLESGVVNRGYLGVQFGPVDQDKADAFGLKEVGGSLVTRIYPDSAAEKAKLQEGDVVVAVDGKPVRKAQDLPYYIGQKMPGDKAQLKIVRNGKERDVEAVLTDGAGRIVSVDNGSNQLGIRVQALRDDLQEAYGVRHGVVVSEVMDKSPAAEAGIQNGDIIQKLHRTPIRSMDDYQAALADLPERGKVAVLVVRPGRGSDFLVIQL
ncbi:trypsin-like peptidase domain-containing protein [Kangiella koreensis]|uniref:Probable periplasmic serine endoprotease DegP-like n=1 Tax=Kangiella koreensis (strain DSM 16069 / JCM 12317 / KCTC 12182 / SW-125) TaxID=523791 RepID=C7RA52_KANKD|nr:trypsin-like peptidase domain-containing protein [Kangiella koreensis]ACV26171.1 protease Do [Kangiella koreensis DSM 16069]